MAMPPQYGGAHPPPIFPGPLLPPVNQPVHTFATQSNGGVSAAEVSSAISNHSPMVSQGSSFYHQHQPSVYINPYLVSNPQSPIQMNMMSPHGMHNIPHSHSHNIGYSSGPAGSNSIMHGNHSSRQIMQNQPQHYSSSRRQPLSVDEELLEEMNTLLLGYLETEDSPHKMEQREKLESVILEYLAITPHRLKFMFHQVLEVLENSIMTRPNFNAHEAACAFDALAQYAANLISQPWRKEYREIKLHNGFWVHQVSSQLTGAEYILELMGYVSTASKSNSVCLDYSSGKPKNSDHYFLQGVIDPDLIARLALDCMIAYCECQSLNKIKEGVSEFSLSWAQILMFRQHYIGGVDVTVRNLLFTLRQRANMASLPTPASPEGNLSHSPPPPLPVRQSSSFAATASAGNYFPHSPKALTPSLQHSPLEARYEAPVDDGHSKFSLQHSPENQKNSRSQSLIGGVTSSATSVAGKSGYRNNYCEEKSNGVHTSTSASKGSSSRVPTAKLIDLDSSAFENSTHHKTAHALLPKVLPHKSSSKSNTNRSCLPTHDQTDLPTTSQPPPEAFQAGTLEEHLEATLNLVKNPLKNPGHFSKGTESSSWETWDFVYKGLEKKGYNKDVGDRGDILHDMARQKNYATDISPSSLKNMNVNMNNQRKDVTKNRPLTINQALQQFTLHETKERVDKVLPSSTKSSHSISHAYVHENHKRNSLYDNLSAGGFETANQDSEESEDKKSSSSGIGRLMPLKKVSNILRQETFNKNYDNTGGGSSFHKSSNSSENTSKSNKGPTAPDSAPSDRYNINGDKIWPCATCTYENKFTSNICEMCGKSRDPGPDTKPLESGGKQCHLCTLINDKNVDVCSACGIDLKGSSTYI
ncbi:Protein tamozhennic [Armadillidium nasatum]|uniref:Protein tamozhennic n=1 Tax=Armadillidium nasatum TaxID=96803 RepID=A0A5N5SUC3_9CRUS|nr:Protein tamozhennic [Armadillidium nasatum]